MTAHQIQSSSSEVNAPNAAIPDSKDVLVSAKKRDLPLDTPTFVDVKREVVDEGSLVVRKVVPQVVVDDARRPLLAPVVVRV